MKCDSRAAPGIWNGIPAGAAVPWHLIRSSFLGMGMMPAAWTCLDLEAPGLVQGMQNLARNSCLPSVFICILLSCLSGSPEAASLLQQITDRVLPPRATSTSPAACLIRRWTPPFEIDLSTLQPHPYTSTTKYALATRWSQKNRPNLHTYHLLLPLSLRTRASTISTTILGQRKELTTS